MLPEIILAKLIEPFLTITGISALAFEADAFEPLLCGTYFIALSLTFINLSTFIYLELTSRLRIFKTFEGSRLTVPFAWISEPFKSKSCTSKSASCPLNFKPAFLKVNINSGIERFVTVNPPLSLGFEVSPNINALPLMSKLDWGNTWILPFKAFGIVIFRRFILSPAIVPSTPKISFKWTTSLPSSSTVTFLVNK